MLPGQFIPGADSHSRAYGAYGAVGMGVGSTTLGFGWSTGYIYFTLAKARRVVFRGQLQPWVSGKDIVLELLRRWGAKQSQGMSVELVDADKQLPIAYRNTIANMMAEAEALNGIFAPDEITAAWYRAKGITELPYPPFAPGADARYEIDETFDLADVQPMIAKPFSPGNAFPAEEVARERLTFDKAMIGSCTNGSYDDLLSAALVVRAARAQGRDEGARRSSWCFPGPAASARRSSGPIRGSAANRSPTCSASVGGEIRQSWCGPCFGQGPDALEKGQRAITSFNRNWQNRMGLGGEGYLASPAVVAASALVGYMAPPSELGLDVERRRVRRVRADGSALMAYETERAVAQSIGVPVAQRHIFLCCDQTKPKCCDKDRGLAAWDYLKARLKELGLSEQGGILRTKANCLRICEGGPIAVVYPEGAWYGAVRSAGARTDHPGAPDRRPPGRRCADHAASRL